MKDSGIKWLGEVPTHWIIERGKNLFNKMDRPIQESDEVVTCFRDGVVTLRKNRRTEGFTESLKEIGYQGIRVGDLVIHAMDASAGAVGIADSNGKGTPVYAVCTPKSNADAHYHASVIQEMARNQWIFALATGIRERSTDFRFGTYAKQRVPLPPLAEQAVIVRYLDYVERRIQRYVRAKRKLLGLLAEQKQAIIHRAVTRGLDPDVPLKPSGVEWLGDVPAHWDVVPLKHWLNINKAVLPENTDAEFKFYYIDIGSVGTGMLTKDIQSIQFKTAPSRARRIVRKDDTIVSTVRTYLKSVWFAENPNDNLVASTGFAVLTPRQKTLPKLVSYVAQSNSFTNRVTAESVGIAYPAIAETRLGTFHISVPPLAEQTAIAEYLDKTTARIDAVIARTHREIELINEYRTRLIADVVTGKVDVREAAAKLPDEPDTDDVMLDSDTDGTLDSDTTSNEIIELDMVAEPKHEN